MFFPYYFDRTILLVLVGMAIVGWAQWRVSHVYKKNQALYTQKGETGAQIARRLLDNAGLHDVPIEVIGGRMSDQMCIRDSLCTLQPWQRLPPRFLLGRGYQAGCTENLYRPAQIWYHPYGSIQLYRTSDLLFPLYAAKGSHDDLSGCTGRNR